MIFQDVVHKIGSREAGCDEQSSFRGIVRCGQDMVGESIKGNYVPRIATPRDMLSTDQRPRSIVAP